MKSTEFIVETVSLEHFTFKVDGKWTGERVFVTMYETPEKDREWLVGSDPVEVGEMTIDLDQHKKTAYLNRIDITYGRGQGRGKVLLSKVLDMIKQQGFVTATAYINTDNSASRGLFKSLGFEFLPSTEWDAQYGDYWIKTL